VRILAALAPAKTYVHEKCDIPPTRSGQMDSATIAAMAELYLVRHAQAAFGTDDYDRLTDLGHRQSKWLGEYFRDRNVAFDRILTGSLRRHRETLEGIAAGGCRVVAARADSRLDE
jgi:broad specificity phosphatase PhoE